MLAHYALQEGGKALEEGLKRKTNKSDEDFVAFIIITTNSSKIGGDEIIFVRSKATNPQHSKPM